MALYKFLSLTPPEIHTRRLILDKYGFTAQLSALGLILLVALSRWLFPPPQTPSPQRKPHVGDATVGDALELTPQSSAARARSPSARGVRGSRAEEEVGLMDGEGKKGDHAGGDGVTGRMQGASSRISKLTRWLDGNVYPGWKETRRQVLAVSLWGVWLGVLVFRETGEDYLHLTKRLAQVPASLLPIQLLLGTPTPLSPLPYLLRTPGSASFNAYHRLHAALLLLMLAGHAVLYVTFYVQNGLWFRFGSVTVLVGLGMVGVLVALTVLAREKVRRERRGVFVWSHVLGAGVLLVGLWVHVSVARWYVVEAGAVWVAGVWGRWWKSRRRGAGAK